MTQNKITSGTYGHGSFGYASNPPDTTMKLWRCGVHIYNGELFARNPTVHIGNNSSPCMHRTRRDAQGCANRKALAAGGDKTKAVNLRGTVVVPQ